MCGDEDSGFLFSGGGGVEFSTNRQIQQDINQKYERLNSLTETRIRGILAHSFLFFYHLTWTC